MIAKLFENGRSQAVRLPKEYRFDDKEVLINKIGDVVILTPISDKWKGFIQSLDMISSDFMKENPIDPPPQERESL